MTTSPVPAPHSAFTKEQPTTGSGTLSDVDNPMTELTKLELDTERCDRQCRGCSCWFHHESAMWDEVSGRCVECVAEMESEPKA
jgi:hypothetical protein